MLEGRKFWQMILLAAILTIAVIAIDFLRRLFDTETLTAKQWGESILCALSVLVVIEAIKAFRRRRAKA
jgi:hypothetical protein